MTDLLKRAQGCFLGQCVGDSLGSLVEFHNLAEIHRKYPNGVYDMADGGPMELIAGQPTDDTEMALMLARSLIRNKAFVVDDVFKSYKSWISTDPFDSGFTTRDGLNGRPRMASQANGALMRISPLGIFGVNHKIHEVFSWARQDAELTHPNPICLQINMLYTAAISYAIKEGAEPIDVYNFIVKQANELNVDPEVMNVISLAETKSPDNYELNMGWVLIAFQNTLWQLLHGENFEEAIVDTIMRGGDTDTNAAICGAFLGAVHGINAIPERWVNTVLECRPEKGLPNVKTPRPECFWPVDALEIVGKLL